MIISYCHFQQSHARRAMCTANYHRAQPRIKTYTKYCNLTTQLSFLNLSLRKITLGLHDLAPRKGVGTVRLPDIVTANIGWETRITGKEILKQLHCKCKGDSRGGIIAAHGCLIRKLTTISATRSGKNSCGHWPLFSRLPAPRASS